MIKQERVEFARRIAAAMAGGRWLKGYVRGKLLADPVFDEALRVVLESQKPVVDLGCGLGLFGLWLRMNGFQAHYTGCDLGQWKIDTGRKAVEILGFHDMELHAGDLTDAPLPGGCVICAFDILHYLTQEQQDLLVSRLAEAAKKGSIILIRNGIKGCGWRSYVTMIEEIWTRATCWIVGGEINFPDLAELSNRFQVEGCSVESKPLWGRTPFSSYWLKVYGPNEIME
jgi:SAM-dependent methyltransferase